jgi:hypothetical protein
MRSALLVVLLMLCPSECALFQGGGFGLKPKASAPAASKAPKAPMDRAAKQEDMVKKRKAGLLILKEYAALYKKRAARRQDAAASPAPPPPPPAFSFPGFQSTADRKAAIERERAEVEAEIAAIQQKQRQRVQSDAAAGIGSIITTVIELAQARVEVAVLSATREVEARLNQLQRAPKEALDAAKQAVERAREGGR